MKNLIKYLEDIFRGAAVDYLINRLMNMRY